MYEYTEGGRIVFYYLSNEINILNWSQFVTAFCVDNWGNVTGNHGSDYVVNRWYKFCDEMAEWAEACGWETEGDQYHYVKVLGLQWAGVEVEWTL